MRRRPLPVIEGGRGGGGDVGPAAWWRARPERHSTLEKEEDAMGDDDGYPNQSRRGW
jgi:hypothetical protein